MLSFVKLFCPNKFKSLCVLTLLFAGASVKAGEKKNYDKMDYGPFLSASIISEPNPTFHNDTGNFTIGANNAKCDVTPRGVAIRLTDDWKAGVIFDMDACRISAGWYGAPLIFKGLIGDGAHGPGPTVGVVPTFQVLYGPGWADKSGSFKDPRADSIAPLPPPGPLPEEQAKYKGLYLYGGNVILSYAINGADVLEMPSLEVAGNVNVFARNFTVAPSANAQALLVATVMNREEKKIKTEQKDKNGKVQLNKEGKPVVKETTEIIDTPASGSVADGIASVGKLHAALIGAPAGVTLEVTGHQIVVKIPANAGGNFKVLIAGGGEASKGDFAGLAKSSPAPKNLSDLTKGGSARWTQEVETKGVLATAGENDAYVTDKLTIPYQNPYNSWMRTGAFDFFADGTKAAVTTWSGDVWIVSGIDAELAHLKWKRFATGLHQPLGLKIVDETIYVVGHDQITRLKDLNGDGEADFYECFNHNWELTSAFHAFCFDLHTDPEGNFLFAFGSPVQGGGRGFHRISKDHGTIIKISKDGSKKETYATGLRAPNGMCVSPTGQVTIGDNEGSWVPTSPLHWVKPGSFLGVSDSAHGAKVEQPKPLMWLSHNGGVDNSCGGQAWVTSEKWGPYKGSLLHMSYGQSSLYLVMPQDVNGQMQGGAVKIPVKFTSSAMRARFNPADGQLYIVGLKGWQTNAGADGGFDRVRYTGKPVHLPAAFKATSKGVYLTYSTALDQAYANDAQNFAAEMWNYKWTSNYGSPEVSVNEPSKNSHDKLEVKSAKLQPDGKTVLLEIPELKPCMQVKLTGKLKAADGVDMKSDVYGTIYSLPGE